MDSFVKDPDAVLDYKIDWSAWLGTDTITASQWLSEDEALVIDSEEASDTETVVWLSGGEIRKRHLVTNRITTADGRTNDRSIRISIKEQ
jgi:hypothetical protein